LEAFDWVLKNKEWLFSGIGLVVFSWVVGVIFKKTKASSTQTIRAGNNSTNVQASRDVSIGTIKNGSDVGKQ
jgi:hypothetical protein